MMGDDNLQFEKIYILFQPKIHRYVTQLVGNFEAEDLTQEIFIKVEKALTSFRNESQLSTWIYRIATNAAIDRIRNSSFQRESANVHPECSATAADHTEFTHKAADLLVQTSSIEEQVICKEMNGCIRGIIEKLPEDYRIVVILSDLEGFKDKEIAEILGVSLNVVKMRLHRAKARLKKDLLNHCNFSWDERNEFTCDPKVSVRK